MTQRQDARRNRERLLDAGEQVFHEHGVSAPLQLVAVRAGVGRGTLYRHFPDRDALAQAVIERRLEHIEHHVTGATDPARSVQDIFFQIADTLCAFPDLFQALAATEQGLATLLQLRDQLHRMLAAPIAAAHAEGLLRDGVTFDDFHTGWAMLQGSLLAVPAGDRARMAERAQTLLRAALFTH